jgi:RNA polymerase sigma factor (TIGR02999 family)
MPAPTFPSRGPMHIASTQAPGTVRAGSAVVDELFRLVYDALRGIARRRLGGERRGHSWSATDLVHEAYLKLARLHRIEWQNEAQFLAVAARAMRHALVDAAVRRRAGKRGGSRRRTALDEGTAAVDAPAAEVLGVHRALERLEQVDARASRVVECRFFAGMSVEETALALGVSSASVKRDWALARAWLHRELLA